MSSKQLIDFEQGSLTTGDSGERDTVAIKPINPGEGVASAVSRRPSENLRLRTEVLRDAADDGMYRDDADLQWVISGSDTAVDGAPRITSWNPTSGVALLDATRDLVIQPLAMPPASTSETVDYVFGVDPNDVTVTFTTQRTSYSVPSANATEIRWEAVTPPLAGSANCVVVLSGTPNHIVTIQVADETGTAVTVDDLMTALNLAATVDGTLETVELTYVRDSAINPDVYEKDVTALPEDTVFSKTVEREKHLLDASAFNGWVSTLGNELLTSGDTIGVAFDSLDDRRTKGAGTDPIVVSAQLFLYSKFPERIPFAIPLVRRIKDALYWLDGTVVEGSLTTALIFSESHYTVKRVETFATTIPLAAHETVTPLTNDPYEIINESTLRTVLWGLTDAVNNKPSLDTTETISADWFSTASLYARGGLASTADSYGFKVEPAVDHTVFDAYRVSYTAGTSGSTFTCLASVADMRTAVVSATPHVIDHWTYDEGAVIALKVLSQVSGHIPSIRLRRSGMVNTPPVLTQTASGACLGEIVFSGANNATVPVWVTNGYLSAYQNGAASSDGSYGVGRVVLAAVRPDGLGSSDITSVELDAAYPSAVLRATADSFTSIAPTTFRAVVDDSHQILLSTLSESKFIHGNAELTLGTGTVTLSPDMTSYPLMCHMYLSTDTVNLQQVESSGLGLRRRVYMSGSGDTGYIEVAGAATQTLRLTHTGTTDVRTTKLSARSSAVGDEGLAYLEMKSIPDSIRDTQFDGTLRLRGTHWSGAISEVYLNTDTAFFGMRTGGGDAIWMKGGELYTTALGPINYNAPFDAADWT